MPQIGRKPRARSLHGLASAGPSAIHTSQGQTKAARFCDLGHSLTICTEATHELGSAAGKSGAVVISRLSHDSQGPWGHRPGGKRVHALRHAELPAARPGKNKAPYLKAPGLAVQQARQGTPGRLRRPELGVCASGPGCACLFLTAMPSPSRPAVPWIAHCAGNRVRGEAYEGSVN